jgi:hypothetical protein
MGALNIPGVGERVNREYTRVVSFGSIAAADVQLSSTELSTAGGTVALININEPNVEIKELAFQVAGKLTTSSGTFTIGDSDDPDGFVTDTLLVGTATGARFNVMASSVGYAGGKVYTSPGVINVTKAGAAVPAASQLTGICNVRVRYIRNADDTNPST